MRAIIDHIVTISGFFTIASFIVMHLYLYSKRAAPFLVLNPLWPVIIFKYRDYTKKNRGKPGIFYYLFLINIFILIPAIISEFLFEISDAHFLVLVLALLVLLPLFSIILYVVIGLSKDDFYNKLF